jgi:hypothetical protein
LLAGAQIYEPGEHPAAPELVGRIYRATTAARRLYTAFNFKKGKR